MFCFIIIPDDKYPHLRTIKPEWISGKMEVNIVEMSLNIYSAVFHIDKPFSYSVLTSGHRVCHRKMLMSFLAKFCETQQSNGMQPRFRLPTNLFGHFAALEWRLVIPAFTVSRITLKTSWLEVGKPDFVSPHGNLWINSTITLENFFANPCASSKYWFFATTVLENLWPSLLIYLNWSAQFPLLILLPRYSYSMHSILSIFLISFYAFFEYSR